jgi:hypothetical protein
MVRFIKDKGWQNHENAGGEHWRKIVVAQADEIQLLKEQIQQEVKEKYQLYETIKQLGGTNGQKENQKATEEVGS